MKPQFVNSSNYIIRFQNLNEQIIYTNMVLPVSLECGYWY